VKALSNGRRARLVSAAMLIGFVSAAGAGPRYNVPGVVSITVDGNGGLVVQGTLGEVRNSSGSVHSISCSQTRGEVINANGQISRSTMVICQARNTERAVICVSSSEAIANALNGVSNDALLELHILGSSCQDIIVYESSGTIRKAA